MTDSIICGGVISTVTVLHSLTPNPRSKLQFGATRTKHNKTESRKTTKLTPGDLYSTFLSTSRLQRVPQLLRNVRCFHPGGVEKCFKVAEILAFALMRPRRCGEKRNQVLICAEKSFLLQERRWVTAETAAGSGTKSRNYGQAV